MIPKEVLEREGIRLHLHRVAFGRQWDSVMDFRRMEEHNRICRELIEAFKVKEEEIEVYTDVDHWEEVNV